MAVVRTAALCAKIESEFLEGLAQPQLDSIFAEASPCRFKANSVVLTQGDPASRVFLLTRGLARHFVVTAEGKKILLTWIRPGQLLGGVALVSKPLHYLVSTETVKDSYALVWDRNTIRDLVARYPRLLDNALAIAVTEYLTWYIAAHVALTSHTAKQRLANVVASLAAGIGHEVPGGTELELTNEELANSANVTPFTVSRLLAEWQRNGALVKKRGKLVLRTSERLLRAA
jgi:CRP-like cAMP-binding protein